jgi:GT2 family glycosyltransferase
MSDVIIDNASGDGSIAAVRNWIDAQDPPPPVTLMVSEANLGFAGGHSTVVRAHPAVFYVLLNSDILVVSGMPTHLLSATQMQPRAGLLAPACEHEDGTYKISCFRSHSPASELGRGAARRITSRLPPCYRRSRTHYFRRLHHRVGPLAANLCWGAGRLIAAARRLVGKPVPKAHACEWRDVWRGFLYPLRPSAAGE